MKPNLIGAILALTLCACSTVSRDTGFAADTGDAFVMVAADGMVINGSQDHRFTFRQINLETGSFTRQHASVTFSVMGPMSGNEFRKPEGMTTTRRFGGKALPPGDYALISHTTITTYGTATNEVVSCYSQGAPVFRIRAGVITLVAAEGQVATVQAHSQVREVLEGYPNMTAQVVPAEMLGSVTFNTVRWLGVQTCAADGDPTFTPVPQT